MKERIAAALAAAARQAFEDLCFTFDAPELAEQQAALAPAAAAEVKFRGAFSGKLVLLVSQDLYTAIAANMLGIPAPAPRQMEDALCEMANVICGNIVPELALGHPGCLIETPRTTTTDLDAHGLLGMPMASCRLNLNQGRADAVVFVDGYFTREEPRP